MPVELPLSGVWDVVVSLDGADVSDRLTGRLRIEAEEAAARIAQFTLLPVGGVVAITAWVGVPVTIDIIQDSTAHRRFTGVVDHPRFDPATRQVTLICTDGRQELLDALDAAAVAVLIPGSHWSSDIFDTEASGLRHAEDRLSTIPASLDLALDGETWQLTPWAAKDTPDHEFERVLDESLSLSVAERRNLVNQIQVDLDYRFSRLRHREQAWSWHWEWPATNDGFCGWFPDTTELPDVEMIERAAERGGWTPNPESFAFTFLPPSSGPPVCGLQSGWINRGFPLVIGAEWNAARRMGQAVTEQYRMTVRAPQSITRHGEVVGRERGVALTPQATEDWEREPALGIPTEAEQDALGDWVIDEHDRAQSDAAIETLLNVARTRIIAAHRQNFVSWQWPGVIPDLDRTDTVRVDAGGVSAQGKVAQLIEEIDIDSGSLISTIRIAVSRAGSDDPVDEDPLEAPLPPDTSAPGNGNGGGPDPEGWLDITAQVHWDESPSDYAWTGTVWDSGLRTDDRRRLYVDDQDAGSFWASATPIYGIRFTVSYAGTTAPFHGFETASDGTVTAVQVNGPYTDQVFTIEGAEFFPAEDPITAVFSSALFDDTNPITISKIEVKLNDD